MIVAAILFHVFLDWERKTGIVYYELFLLKSYKLRDLF